MEVDGDDLENLFEEQENESREHDTENRESAGVRVAPPKRIVKNPRLKFNPERLCGERGIPVLVDHFKDVKFRGKGHEKEDLDKLLASLEHWTHRLFPSMKFEDCLHHIEKLGKKRPVQTCLRKIRLDMPILDTDFVKDDEDNVLRNDDPDPEAPVVDAFDRLIAESQDTLNHHVPSVENLEASSAYSPLVTNDNRGQALGSSFGSSLTEEQKERMAHNRLLAAERRKAKFAAMQLNTSDSQAADINAGSSRNSSSAFESLFKSSDSAVNKETNTSNKVNTTCMETDNNIHEASSSLHLDNPNSENLGLDDLIDLVDEEESVSDENIAVKQRNASGSRNKNYVKENSEVSFKDTDPIILSNSTTDFKIDTSKDILLEGITNNYLDKENSKENGICFEDTVPINISTSNTDLNMDTANDISEKGAINKNFNEENEICLQDTVPINVSNSTMNLNMDLSKVLLEETGTVSSKTSEITNNELLGLESMMDLIDD